MKEIIANLTEREKAQIVVDLIDYQIQLKQYPLTKATHYHRLEEFRPHDWVHKQLGKVGFRNGDVQYNDKFPLIRFWYEIYSMVGSIHAGWVPDTMEENVSDHHSSSYRRFIRLWILIEALKRYLQGHEIVPSGNKRNNSFYYHLPELGYYHWNRGFKSTTTNFNFDLNTIPNEMELQIVY